MTGKKAFLLVSMSCALALAGCRWYQTPPGQQVDRSWLTDIDKPEVYGPDGELLHSERQTRPYALGVRDKINVEVRNHPEFSAAGLKIDRQGKIRIPNTDIYIYAKDKSADEISQEIGFALRKYLKTDPFVTIHLQEAHARVYYVIGDPIRAGRFEMGEDEITLRDALIAGEAHRSEDSNLASVYVIRPDKYNPTYILVNGYDLLLGKTRDNLTLQDGDVVYVPRTWDKNLESVVDKVLSRMRDYIEADSNFQTIQNLLPERDRDLK